MHSAALLTAAGLYEGCMRSSETPLPAEHPVCTCLAAVLHAAAEYALEQPGSASGMLRTAIALAYARLHQVCLWTASEMHLAQKDHNTM